MTFPLSGLVDVYTNQVPLESDILRSNTYRMADNGMLAKTILGVGINNTVLFSGLPCAPIAPPGLQVVVGSGATYSLQNYLPTAFGVLPQDTDPNHDLYKQGILFDPVTLNTPAPAGGGNSVIYLVQAQFLEQDVNIVSRPYFNSADPASPIFISQSDTRIDTISVQIKAGAASPSPTPPTPDAGYTGLYYVTVANGQSSIIAGDITVVPGAPFVTESLTQKVSYRSEQNSVYVSGTDISGTPNTITVNPSPAYTSYVFGTKIWVKVANSNTGATNIDINSLGAVAVVTVNDSGSLPCIGGEMFSGGIYEFFYDGTNFQLLNSSKDIAISEYSEVQLGSNQSVSTTETKINFDTIPTDGDPLGWWDPVNFWFAPGKTGRFRLSGFINATAGATQNILYYLYIDGVQKKIIHSTAYTVSVFSIISFICDFNLTDPSSVVQLWTRTNTGSCTINGVLTNNICQLSYEGKLPF